MSESYIRIRGARQNTLRGVDVDIPLGKITAVTGLSGSGKSSLAFDTLYAEGQRRYVESFTPYARQFMERMDRPDVDSVEGVLPAVAIDQKNTIRSSRSTVGTVTELLDYFKVLFANLATPHCPQCQQALRADSPHDAAERVISRHLGARAIVLGRFNTATAEEGRALYLWLQNAGLMRAWVRERAEPLTEALAAELRELWVVFDRISLATDKTPRLAEALEAAYSRTKGLATVVVEQAGAPLTMERLSTHALHCATCDCTLSPVLPNHFSFNSPLGACARCNGFGAVIDVDLDLVIPDAQRSLAQGCIKPWSTPSTEQERQELEELCIRRGIPMEKPWAALSAEHRALIVNGDKRSRFMGIRGYFQWLETQTYKMHVRVLVNRYRAYNPCPECGGTRLQANSLQWRLWEKNIAELCALPLEQLQDLARQQRDRREVSGVAGHALDEVLSRLRYLCEVGLHYLTMDRPSRTLSGGEVQRVNLTSAVGSALVNTLFVLDEPSVGLHPRDNERLVKALERLRDNGNTIVLVEHDDAIFMRADHLLEMGPGPGKDGGTVVFSGPPRGLFEAPHSATARGLALQDGTREAPRVRRVGADGFIRVQGAAENNLQDLDVEIPKRALTVLTGVSGSGKSTLLHQVLYRGLTRLRGEPCERPGKHREISGFEDLTALVLVDQSPVGSTPRSNPATYVGAFDGIRQHFAATAEAKLRGLTASAFSFNSGSWSCSACQGNGFERIEMQFLADQFLVCERCNGRRFEADLLEVRLRSLSIADVLELTVSAARRFFDDEPSIERPLASLERVGLGYLLLGQPLNTLSGGESQRLKLARHLDIEATRGALYLLDEPTTGLHLLDVKRLIDNLHALVDAGNTVVIIEHNLDVVAAADHVIDLGPEAGARGGRVVVAGPPEHVAKCAASVTGQFLARHGEVAGKVADGPVADFAASPASTVRVLGARVNNLREVTLEFPRDRFVVITGPSGSGKSSLAFDVLFAEGQRRFVDCLSPYARQYVQQPGRPDLDGLFGVPPTVCISQRAARGSRKSTVATVTELHHFLRLLWARLGTHYCPDCGCKAAGLTVSDVAHLIATRFAGVEVRLMAPAVRGRRGWHKEIIERSKTMGVTELRIDGRLYPASSPPKIGRHDAHDIDWVVARFSPEPARLDSTLRYVERGLEWGSGVIQVLATETGPTKTYSLHRQCPECDQGFESPDPRLFSFHATTGACEVCNGLGVEGVEDTPSDATVAAQARLEAPCRSCNGSRLNALARSVRLQGRGIDEVLRFTPEELETWLQSSPWSAREQLIGGPAIREALARARFLRAVGLEHLTLDRGAHTLSGGEAQRIRLAAQLSAELAGVLYVLDEPTIGLHPQDNHKVLAALRGLVSRGNSVVVVEHDEETILRSDWLIEMGPGGGTLGGRVVAAGPTTEVLGQPACATADALRMGGKARCAYMGRAIQGDGAFIEIVEPKHNNLDIRAARIPKGRLTVVTGPSGSGKSSLIRDVLGQRGGGGAQARLADRVLGLDDIKLIREIDQSPIGRTPASTPATYVGLYDEIRKLFAALPESKTRGYSASRFSFNTSGGRCDACKGQGEIRHEMSFMPDASTRCESCNGRRFEAETLAVQYRGASIADVLEMTVVEALGHFGAVPSLAKKLRLMEDVGLGYLHLGQPSHTLSGGEAQRIKLVEELHKEGGKGSLYLLDEPSTGLHMTDLMKLTALLQRIVDRGDTVVVIEHNLDVIASADWLLEMGPGGGKAGGKLLYQGPRDGILHKSDCPTAPYLRAHLGAI
jgi:excinuclease ABC subunit A